jgi:hypothetical protein
LQAGRQGDGNAVAGQEGGRGRQPSRQRAEALSQLGMHAPAGPAPLVQTAPPASCRPRLHPRRLPDPLANLQSRCKRRSSRLKAARCKGNTCIRLHACMQLDTRRPPTQQRWHAHRAPCPACAPGSTAPRRPQPGTRDPLLPPAAHQGREAARSLQRGQEWKQSSALLSFPVQLGHAGVAMLRQAGRFGEASRSSSSATR